MTRWTHGLPWARPPAVPAPSAPGAPLLEAAGVVVERGGRAVVRAVDLVVRAGEVVALVGPNGAGKSTLLHALSGDLPVAGGSVLVAGRPVEGWSPGELALRRAVLPQDHGVSFPFTVEQVVRMARAPWLGTAEDARDDAAVRAAMVAADVADLAARPVSQLSGGERARTALARVLAQATQLLFLDEPTAALDLHHQEATLRCVRERAAGGSAVVVVLHDLGQAAAHADRIAVLAEGTVVADGPPREVLRPELLSVVYRHPIEVIDHPTRRRLLVVPER